jgi:glycosyltransferase involved in cell wall biosynthesis
VNQSKTLKPDQPFTITFIGRVSPEKGVDFIFSALEALNECQPVLLRIAGANASTYCTGLRAKYPVSVGIHTVEWLGWSKVEPLFLTTDVTIIPSQWIDNTPLSLIEALAYKTPVIATRVPPIEDLLVEGETGFMADFGSVHSLTDAIRRAVSHKSGIRSGSIVFPRMHRLNEYMAKIVEIYRAIGTTGMRGGEAG